MFYKMNNAMRMINVQTNANFKPDSVILNHVLNTTTTSAETCKCFDLWRWAFASEHQNTSGAQKLLNLLATLAGFLNTQASNFAKEDVRWIPWVILKISSAVLLSFSFIGLASQEVAIGSRSVVDVVMSSDVEELQEVVVTALGITKEKAALGYAVTSVGGEQLEARPEADIARLLRGKVPGVDIKLTT